MAIAFLVGTGLCSVLGGEPIQITKSPEKVELPQDPSKELPLPSGIFNSRINGGESSQGPALPVPSSPVLLPNKKLEELLKQKKNWMEAPNNVDSGQAIEQIFGIRKYELNSGENASKGEMERIYDTEKDGRNSKSGHSTRDHGLRPGTPDRSDAKDSRDKLGEGDDLQNENPGIIKELNPAYLFNWASPQDALAPLGGGIGRSTFLPRTVDDPFFGQRGGGQTGRDLQPQGPREIERIFNGGKAPLGRIGDPINSQADATRAIFNPIAAMKPSAPPPSAASSSSLTPETPTAFGSIVPSLSSRSDAFSFGHDKGGLGSGFSAPAAPAASMHVMQPKPAILEIPRPRF